MAGLQGGPSYRYSYLQQEMDPTELQYLQEQQQLYLQESQQLQPGGGGAAYGQSGFQAGQSYTQSYWQAYQGKGGGGGISGLGTCAWKENDVGCHIERGGAAPCKKVEVCFCKFECYTFCNNNTTATCTLDRIGYSSSNQLASLINVTTGGFGAIPEDREIEQPTDGLQQGRKAEAALHSWKTGDKLMESQPGSQTLSSDTSTVDLKDFLSKRGKSKSKIGLWGC